MDYQIFLSRRVISIYSQQHRRIYILNKGGQIFLAIVNDKVVGCCALIAHPENQTFEMAKMALSPQAQGLGLGHKLGETLIQYAKERGIKRIFLELLTAPKKAIL